MPVSVDVQVSGFAGRSNLLPDGSRIHAFQPRDLLRAAVLAGYPPLSATPNDRRLRNWRFASLHLALQADWRFGSARLIQPEIWRRLDPSEKGSVKLVLGNIMAKLLVEQLLGAPIMVFFDLYRRSLGIALPANQRPDFIAIGAGGLRLSVEAKGRARRMPPKGFADAKAQAIGVTQVLGAAVTAQIVVECHFESGVLCACLHDPEPEFEPPIPDEKLVTDYYAPVQHFLQEAREDFPGSLATRVETFNNVPLAFVPAGDFFIGLRPEVSELLHDEQAGRVPGMLSDLAEQFAHDRQLPAGRDGVIVVPGGAWREMEKLAEHAERRGKQ